VSTIKDPRSPIEKYVEKYWENNITKSKKGKLSILDIDT